MKKICITLLACGVLTCLASCEAISSLLNKDGQRAVPVVVGDGTEVSAGTAGQEASEKHPTADSREKSPTDAPRHAKAQERKNHTEKKPETPRPAPTAAEKPTAKGAAVMKTPLAGRWEITAVGRDTLPALDEVPCITFEETEGGGRFYADNGCNIINGDWVSNADGTIKLDHVLSTLRMCQDAPLQYEISAALGDGRTYAVTIQPSDGILTMRLSEPGAGRPAMTLIHRRLSWLNGQWRVAEIGATAYDDDAMNLFFDLPEMKVHGNTGCNYFNGDLTTDAAVPYSLNFSSMGVTKMACPDTTAETAMLVALEQTVSVRPSGDDGALLLDPRGRVLMRLVRQPETAADGEK